MTIESFNVALKAYRKAELFSALILIIVLMSMAVLSPVITSRVERVGFDLWCLVGTIVTTFVFITAATCVIRWPQKKVRNLSLCCPHCKKALVGLSSQVVIATRNCGFCGEKVLE